jgi:hypothetical protein
MSIESHMLKCQIVAIWLRQSLVRHTYLTENISVNDDHFALFRPPQSLPAAGPEPSMGAGQAGPPARGGKFLTQAH